MRDKSFRVIVCIAALLALTDYHQARAEDSYVPPPLFGDPAPIPAPVSIAPDEGAVVETPMVEAVVPKPPLKPPAPQVAAVTPETPVSTPVPATPAPAVAALPEQSVIPELPPENPDTLPTVTAETSPQQPALPPRAAAGSSSAVQDIKLEQTAGQLPINADILLDHPADKVSERAKDIVPARPEPVKVAAITKTDDSHRVTPPTKVPLPRVKSLREPTLKKTVTTYKAAGPKFAILSRDPATGAFKKVDTSSRIVKSEGVTQEIRYQPSGNAERLPPMPPVPVESVAMATPLIPPPTPEDERNAATREMVATIMNNQEPAAAPGPAPAPQTAPTPLLPLPDEDTTAAPSSLSAPMRPVALAIPPATETVEKRPTVGELLTIDYKPRLTALDEEKRLILTDNVLAQLKSDDRLRIEIRAFASPSEDGESADRRVSLSRALEVREYLKNQGIAAARMDVRALGRNTARAPLDRVDLILLPLEQNAL